MHSTTRVDFRLVFQDGNLSLTFVYGNEYATMQIEVSLLVALLSMEAYAFGFIFLFLWRGHSLINQEPNKIDYTVIFAVVFPKSS